jgi:hypothetical protein
MVPIPIPSTLSTTKAATTYVRPSSAHILENCSSSPPVRGVIDDQATLSIVLRIIDKIFQSVSSGISKKLLTTTLGPLLVPPPPPHYMPLITHSHTNGLISHASRFTSERAFAATICQPSVLPRSRDADADQPAPRAQVWPQLCVLRELRAGLDRYAGASSHSPLYTTRTHAHMT